MRIFTEKTLKEFAEVHPDALLPLQIWADIVKSSHWTCYADVKQTKITNEQQFEWAVARVEQLLPLVTDETPRTDPNSIELELLSNLVADYSDEHYSIGKPSTLKIIQEIMDAHHVVEPVF